MPIGFSIFSILFVIVFFLALLIPILIGTFVYKDAKKRNMDAVLWTVIAIFAPGFIGLVIYLIMRSNYSDLQCPGCAQSVIESYAVCPHCGYNLRARCVQCGSNLEPGWQVCPECGTPISDAVRSNLPKTASKKSPAILIALIVAAVVLPLLVVIALSAGFVFNKVGMSEQDAFPKKYYEDVYEDFYEDFYEEMLPGGMQFTDQTDFWIGNE